MSSEAGKAIEYYTDNDLEVSRGGGGGGKKHKKLGVNHGINESAAGNTFAEGLVKSGFVTTVREILVRDRYNVDGPTVRGYREWLWACMVDESELANDDYFTDHPITVMRGAGGQGRQAVQSGHQFGHIPTGLVINGTQSRSHEKNKDDSKEKLLKTLAQHLAVWKVILGKTDQEQIEPTIREKLGQIGQKMREGKATKEIAQAIVG